MEQTEAELQDEKPIFNIVGEKVALGPMQKSMLPLFVRWANDFDVAILSGDPIRPVRRELIEADFERDSKSEESQHSIEFLIYEQASLRCIGTTFFKHIDKTQRTAEYGIVIGEKDCWGRGYGTETTLLMLDYAFTVLGLHNVLLQTYAYNERAVRAYTRAGFRVMGRWREAARLGNQVYDIVFMDCLATEFRSPLRRVIELP
ncbi:MAG TPA: GNAT family protein [Ktedonobacteraceae bacterium]|nr:GNAT family protein [Ktedonobacteraceae bacterium]